MAQNIIPLLTALAGMASQTPMGGNAMPNSGATPTTQASPTSTQAAPTQTAPAQVSVPSYDPNIAAAATANAPSPAAHAAGQRAALASPQAAQAATQASGQASGQNTSPMTPQPSAAAGPVASPTQEGALPGIGATTTPQEAAAQGAQGAQTPAERSFFETVLQNLTGHDANGNLLTGEALRDFQTGHSLGGFLGALGQGIGGDSTGGRLAGAVYNQAAGGLSADNAARQQVSMNELMKAAIGNISGRGNTSSPTSQPGGGAIPQASGSKLNQPIASPSSSLPQEPGTGGPTLSAQLDDMLARMRQLV